MFFSPSIPLLLDRTSFKSDTARAQWVDMATLCDMTRFVKRWKTPCLDEKAELEEESGVDVASDTYATILRLRNIKLLPATAPMVWYQP